VFAQKALTGANNDAARVAWAFERATGRRPEGPEAAVLIEVLEKHRKDFAEKPEEAKKLLAVGDASVPENVAPDELAAWTGVCRVILNLHETITRQ
jgi:hypothetical protein